MRCGCGGNVEQKKGCLKYLDSEAHDLDTDHEGMMRSGGLGFGIALDSATAMMSMHLQANGFSFKESDEILSLRAP